MGVTAWSSFFSLLKTSADMSYIQGGPLKMSTLAEIPMHERFPDLALHFECLWLELKRKFNLRPKNDKVRILAYKVAFWTIMIERTYNRRDIPWDERPFWDAFIRYHKRFYEREIQTLPKDQILLAQKYCDKKMAELDPWHF